MVTLDELIREGESIRAEEMARSPKEYRSKIQGLGLPMPVEDSIFGKASWQEPEDENR